jgi:hypothetical protein
MERAITNAGTITLITNGKFSLARPKGMSEGRACAWSLRTSVRRPGLAGVLKIKQGASNYELEMA